MGLLDDLNQEQIAAVKAAEGPVLVIAGAGTGKTKVITSKIAYLMLEKKVKPSEILALTFTEKAAAEMEERVDLLMPFGYEEIWIMTFHAFADRILKQEALTLGLDPEYKLMSQAENWLFIRRHLFELPLDFFRPLGNPTKFIHALIAFFSRLKDELISPSDFSDYAKKLAKDLQKQTLPEGQENEEVLAEEVLKTNELARVYEQYQKFLIQESQMDFGDLLFNTYKLFSQKKTVFKKYQNRFRYILVDEFQDTNYAQNEIVKLLGKGAQNITVCGDDDQSIYKFRGASVSNILQFRKDFPSTKTFVLSQNYRSTQIILDKAYDFIQYNNPERLEVKEKVNKKLKSSKKNFPQAELEIISAKHEFEEAELVVRKIVELALHEKRAYRDFAILARANDHLRPFQEVLRWHNLPFQLLGKRGLYSEKIIKDIIVYLRFIANPADNLNLLQILRMSFVNLSQKAVPFILQYSKRLSYSLWEIIQKADELKIPDAQKLWELVEILRKQQAQALQLSVSQLFYRIIIDTGFLKEMLIDEDRHAEEILNLNHYYKTLREFEKNSPDKSVFSYVDYIDMMIEAGDDPKASEMIEDRNAVKLITVHSAKGLEFPVVFMVSLAGQRFPAIDRSDSIEVPDALVKEIIPSGDVHLQEERRLFYVGMTRAEDRLFFSFADLYGSGVKKRKPSKFLEEVFGREKIEEIQKREANFDLTAGNQPPVLFKNPEIVWQKLLPKHFSYSQLNTFKRCPLQYKHKYIYNLPAPSTHAQIFGQTIHRTLKDFYELIIKGRPKSLEILLSLYEKNWQREGYLDPRHVEQQNNEGKQILKNFYESNKTDWGSPLYLEKAFICKLDADVAVQGYFDRVDVFPDGRIEIIDYKTNNPKEFEKEQKEAEKNLQLDLYALAGQKSFNWDLSKTTLNLYFVTTNQKFSVRKIAEELLETQNEIVELIREIRKSSFEPRKGFNCQFCAYKNICPLW